MPYTPPASAGGASAWGGITGTLATQTDLQSALDAKQVLDADLTAIAALTATTDNFIVAAASAWASRTPTQAKTSLALAKADVGLSSVDNTADTGKPVSTAQQTALNLKADLVSPSFSGTPSLPTGTTGATQAAADSSTKLATTAFVKSVPLDTLAATTDIVTLNASITAHGLLPKLSNVSTQFLNGVGAFSVPAGGGGGGASLGLIVASIAGMNLN